MINLLAHIIVLFAGLYLLVLALVSVLKPDKAAGFFLGHVSSAALHYLELFIRIIIGTAFVIRAPLMPFTGIFSIFGWLLIATSACLLLIPWHWHQKFARKTVPQALRYLTLIAVCSFAMAGFIITCAILGRPT
jgi:hypothetical protein